MSVVHLLSLHPYRPIPELPACICLLDVFKQPTSFQVFFFVFCCSKKSMHPSIACITQKKLWDRKNTISWRQNKVLSGFSCRLHKRAWGFVGMVNGMAWTQEKGRKYVQEEWMGKVKRERERRMKKLNVPYKSSVVQCEKHPPSWFY